MNKPLKHHHLLITAKVNNPPGVDDQEYAQQWLREMIDAIGMKLLRGPISAYVDVAGNKGLTLAAIIETSHIAMHIWDETLPARIELDVYSCATLDPKIVFEYLALFDPVEYEWKFIDREHGLKELHTNKWTKRHSL